MLKDYPNITVHGKLNTEKDTNIRLMKKCPICGYPLQLRYKKAMVSAYGCVLMNQRFVISFPTT